jgi:hypothetical protein
LDRIRGSQRRQKLSHLRIQDTIHIH